MPNVMAALPTIAGALAYSGVGGDRHWGVVRTTGTWESDIMRAHCASSVTQLVISTLSQIRQHKPAWLSHQSDCLRTADDVLLYPAQPFGTVCGIISETLVYLSTFFRAIQRVTYLNF